MQAIVDGANYKWLVRGETSRSASWMSLGAASGAEQS